MPKASVVWVVLEMTPDGNGLDDVMPYLFRIEQEAERAAGRIREETDSDVEYFSLPIQGFVEWERDFEAAKGEED